LKRALILSGGGARGAFQVGVCQYLKECNWEPDLICGTSVGSINAVALGSGMPLEKIAAIWTSHSTRKIFRLRLWRFFWAWLWKKPFQPMADTAPMRSLISRHLDMRALRECRREVIITAVNMLSSRLRLFHRQEIEVEHVMASCAMPGLFPWQMIDGEPYWDGGMMANTPLFPAMERGADEIVVVLLSPAGHTPVPLPHNPAAVAELALEHFLGASYQRTCTHREPASSGCPEPAGPRIAVVAPSRMLGLFSLIHFSRRQAHRLIREGYQNARSQLETFMPSISRKNQP